MKRRTKNRLMMRPEQPLDDVEELKQVWSLDFMRDTLHDSRPFRTLNFIDESNLLGLRIEIGRSFTAARVVRIMNELIKVYGRPHAIRLDNGAELTSYAFTEWAEQNAFIERFNKSFRHEVFDANLLNTFSEAQELAEEWLRDYDDCRPHESLGNMPPAVFKARVFKSEISNLEL